MIRWIKDVLDLRKSTAGDPPEQTKLRAVAARRLLEDETISTGFDDLARSLVASWLSTEPHQTEEREAIWYQFRALQGLHRSLTKAVEDAQVLEESERLAAEKEAQKRDPSRNGGRQPASRFTR